MICHSKWHLKYLATEQDDIWLHQGNCGIGFHHSHLCVLVNWCSVHFFTQEHHFSLVTGYDCLSLCHHDVHNCLLN